MLHPPGRIASVQQDPPTQDTLELPDIPALSSAEVVLPTLAMNSSELGDISLSGLINTIITPDNQGHVLDPAMQVVQVDPNTIQGQNQPITFHLQPMEDQPDATGPVRDIRDTIQGFPAPAPGQQQAWHQDLSSVLGDAKPLPQAPVQAEQKPSVRIVEQPASHKLRFRYKCEGRGAGALQGERSTADKKTFPKIQICGYKGPAVVVVSCVTHDSEVPKTHPHNLVSPASVGRDGCKKGVCTMNVNNEEMSVEFPHLGIQCVRKKDIAEALKLRQEIRVDPYRQGFGHVDSPNSIDLNAVKLCFQVFLENPSAPGKYTVILPPVCSKPIFDAKAKKELQIMDMSDNTAPAEGGKKIIILCEKVSKEDIKVRFFDYNGWEEWADFGPAGVHKQYAISLTAPRYSDPGITEAVRVGVELVKPSDDSRSEEEEFFYLPSSRPGPAPAPPQPAPVKRETVLRNLDTQPKNVYSGGGYVTEVKREGGGGGGGGGGETWQQMTSGLAPAKPRPQDPYSKVVLTEGNNLGLSSYTFEYNIPGTQGAGAGGEFGLQQYNQSPYSETQSPYSNMSQPSPDSSGLANLNIAGSSPMAQPPNVSDSDIVNILGLQDPPTDSDMHNLSDKLGEFSLGATTTALGATTAPAQARAAPKRSSRQAENDSASQLIPRQMERQQSSITTPNVTSELSDILNNCKQINDL